MPSYWGGALRLSARAGGVSSGAGETGADCAAPSMSYRARLKHLEKLQRAAEPQPHAHCLALFQSRIWAIRPREAWEPDTILPLERPMDDPAIYPLLSCFHGPDVACPHRRWADYCYRRDRHLHAMRDLTEDDLGEKGPPTPPETLTRQRKALATLCERMSADLPQLERKLERTKSARQQSSIINKRLRWSVKG